MVYPADIPGGGSIEWNWNFAALALLAGVAAVLYMLAKNHKLEMKKRQVPLFIAFVGLSAAYAALHYKVEETAVRLALIVLSVLYLLYLLFFHVYKPIKQGVF